MDCTDPDGCTLESTELIDRTAQWREVTSKALSRKVEPDRITSIYPLDDKLLSRLRELIAAEADCCSFLKFKISTGEDHTVVQVTFPEHARSLVETVMA